MCVTTKTDAQMSQTVWILSPKTACSVSNDFIESLILINVNFGNPNISFSGFINSVDLFGKPKHNADKQHIRIPSPEINALPWPLKDNSVASAKLIYVLEQPGVDLMGVMQELYRVCADGALIEIRARTSQYLKKYVGTDELLIDKNILSIFSRKEREQIKDDLNNPAVSKLDCDIRLISTYLTFSNAFMQRLQNNEFETDEEFAEAVQESATAVEYQTFVLGVYKDPKHNFVFTRLPEVAPFNLRISDNAANEDDTMSYQLLTQGVYNGGDTRLYIHLLNNLARTRLALQKPVRVATIGSDIGWFPIVSARLAPNVLVDAFEHHPKALEVLGNNVELGTLEERVLVYPFALSNEKGTRKELIASDNENNDEPGSISFSPDGQILLSNSSMEEVEIETDTLENVYSQIEPEGWPDFIVMDGQGYDQSIFDGAKGMFEKGFRPVIFCKFAPNLMKDPDNVTYYRDLIESYGYKAYRITSSENVNEPSGLTPVDLDYIESTYTLLANVEVNLQSAYLKLLFVQDDSAK